MARWTFWFRWSRDVSVSCFTNLRYTPQFLKQKRTTLLFPYCDSTVHGTRTQSLVRCLLRILKLNFYLVRSEGVDVGGEADFSGFNNLPCWQIEKIKSKVFCSSHHTIRTDTNIDKCSVLEFVFTRFRNQFTWFYFNFGKRGSTYSQKYFYFFLFGDFILKRHETRRTGQRIVVCFFRTNPWKVV